MNESEPRRSVYARTVGPGARTARKSGEPVGEAPSKTQARCCQSCGISFHRDPQGGAAAGDGGRTSRYCSYCFRDGKFTAPALTVAEMQALVRTNLRTMGIPEQYAEVFLRRIPRLARWAELAAGSAQASDGRGPDNARDDGLLIAEAEA